VFDFQNQIILYNILSGFDKKQKYVLQRDIFKNNPIYFVVFGEFPGWLEVSTKLCLRRIFSQKNTYKNEKKEFFFFKPSLLILRYLLISNYIFNLNYFSLYKSKISMTLLTNYILHINSLNCNNYSVLGENITPITEASIIHIYNDNPTQIDYLCLASFNESHKYDKNLFMLDLYGYDLIESSEFDREQMIGTLVFNHRTRDQKLYFFYTHEEKIIRREGMKDRIWINSYCSGNLPLSVYEKIYTPHGSVYHDQSSYSYEISETLVDQKKVYHYLLNEDLAFHDWLFFQTLRPVTCQVPYSKFFYGEKPMRIPLNEPKLCTDLNELFYDDD